MITWVFTVTIYLASGPLYAPIEFKDAVSCRDAQEQFKLLGPVAWSKSVCVPKTP